MFQRLVRRISTSFYPRPDRPWNDDATSTAPSIQIGSKRRLADSDDEDDYSQSVSMPPPSSLPGTPTTPGYGSVTKKQRVGMDVDGEESTQAKAGEVREEAVQVGEEKVEEGVKEVTEGVREVEITSQASDAHPPKSETQTASNDIVEVDPPAADAAKSEEPAKEAVPSTESIEEATAAAVPLPESPDLRAQVEAPALESGEISAELSTDEATKSTDATAKKLDAPADKEVPLPIQPAENVEEAKEGKVDSVLQATTDLTP